MNPHFLAKWLRSILLARQKRGGNRACRPRLEVNRLEDRINPGSIDLTGISVVNTSGQTLPSVSAGEWVDIKVSYTSANLPSNATYQIDYTVNGVAEETGNVTLGAGDTSGSWSYYFGTFDVAPGTNYVEVGTSQYATNTLSSTFTGATPAVGNVYMSAALIRSAYGINNVPAFGSAAANGAGQTIAIIDPYDDPSIFTDLDGFDQAMSLTPNSTETIYQADGPASSFLSVYNQNDVNITADIGDPGTGGVPAQDPSGSSWQGETTIDIEWAHAIAPGANIDLIEADNNSGTNLFDGIAAASDLSGVSVVSMSWGVTAWSGETADDSTYFVTPAGHTGITYLNSSGDDGAVTPGSPGSADNYPETSPNVVSVGGTKLILNNDGYGSETGWSFQAPAATTAYGSSSYSDSGTWTANSGGFSSTYGTAAGGSSATAEWTIPITSADTGGNGHTEISATWTAASGNATNATYTIYNGTGTGGTVLGTISINQSQAPVGITEDGYEFQELGVFQPTLTSGDGTVTVVLNASSANGTVVADAVGAAQSWAGKGGISAYETEPAYQSTVQDSGYRSVPDVALDSSGQSGYYYYENGSLSSDYFGTSVATPAWAGLIAIADQGRVADGGPTLNSSANPQQTLEALYSLPSSAFNSITTGYNGYPAGSGYNLDAGLGTPIANLLVPDLVAYGITPTVTGVTADEGPTSGGNTVTITGTNFFDVSAVQFGSTQATSFTVVSATEIKAVVPAETAGKVDVTVTTQVAESATSSADYYTYVAAPAVSEISPDAGSLAGGTFITITGSNFSNAIAVDFGSTAATSYTIVSASEIAATTPANTLAGPQDVTVTTIGGTSATSQVDWFNYLAQSTPPATVQILVPAYFYPSSGGSDWDQLDVAASQVGITAIMNPDSGPGASQDPNYVTAVQDLEAAGGQVIGYVPTDYANTPLATVEEEIDDYESWYPVDGIFLDEMTTADTTQDVDYYQTLYQYIHGLNASWTVVGNPGANPAEDYASIPLADTLVDFENTSTAYGSNTPPSWQPDFPANQFANIVYGVSSISTMQADVSLAASQHTDWVYITDASDANPYDVLPSYWNALVATAADVQDVPQALPVVSGVSPAAGPLAGGLMVTITGQYLENASAVLFGGVGATIARDTATQIVANEPAGSAGTVDVQVTTTGGTSAKSAADQFTYTLAPSVSSISQAAGPATGGTTITIDGSNLANATSVEFGSAAAVSIQNDSADQIVVEVPAESAGTVYVTVTTPGGTSATSSANEYTFVAAPSISSLTPGAGPLSGGTTITIGGDNLASATVDIGGVQAVIDSDSENELEVTAPSGTAGAASLTVTTIGGTATGSFTYVAAPGIGSISPAAGPVAGGTAVTITGSNLANAAVTFAGTAGTVATDSASQIIVTTPASAAGAQSVVVTTAGGTASGTFTYAAVPAVSDVSPYYGPIDGGTDVTISGSALANASAVDFGGVAATSFIVVNATEITAIAPAEAAGSVDVTVTTAGGTSADNTSDQFLFVPPADPSTSSLSLSESSVESGSGITITLQAKDSSGNDLTTGGATVIFSLAGTGSGDGTFSSVTDNQNGTYSAVFTGTLAGNNNITATLNGQTVTSGSPAITVTPGPVSLAASAIELESGSVAAGTTDTVTLQAKDAAGNDLTTSGLTVQFAVGSGTGQGNFSQVTDNGDGTYTATFTGTTAGSNTIVATIGGQAVTSTAPSITVTPGVIDPANAVVSVQPASVAAGSETTVTMQTRDAFGNDLTTGGATVLFALGSGDGQGNIGQTADNQNGTYTATLTGGAAGSNTITATVNGTQVTTTLPTVSVTPGPISALSSVTIASGTVESGGTDTVTLQAVDTYGNDLTTGGANVVFSLGNTAGEQGTFSTATYSGNGQYTATFTGNLAGTNTVTATINGQAISTIAASLTVTPGAIDPANSLVTLSLDTVAAGSSLTVTVYTRDAAGNDLTTGGAKVVPLLGDGVGQGTLGSAIDNGNGTYTASFSGTIAGLNTITATVNGTAIVTPAASVSVTPGPINPFASTVTLSSNAVAAGSGLTVTLHAADIYGNPLTAGGLSVAFGLGSPSGGQGTFTLANDNNNGTYTATFTGTTAGSNTIVWYLDGQEVINNSPKVNVSVGPVASAQCSATLATASIASGSVDNLTISLADAYDNPITTGFTGSFSLGSGDGQGMFGPIVNNGDGTYTVPFTGTTAGANSIAVVIAGQRLAPVPITVTPGPVSLQNSTLTFVEPEVQYGGETTLVLQAVDANNNPLTTGGLNVVFFVNGPGRLSQFADQGNGTYTEEVTSTGYGSITASADIDGSPVSLSSPPILSITGNPVSASKSVLTLSGKSVEAGNPITVELQAKDAKGEVETAGGLNVTFKLENGKNVTLIPAVDGNDGTYTAIINPTAAGSDTITATIAGVNGSPKAATLKVTPGTPSLAISKFTVSVTTVKSGSKITLTAQPEDAFGNKVIANKLDVGFSLLGGTASGTFGPLTYHPSTGTYTETFTGTTAGSNTITASIGGQTITSSSQAISVVPGAASAVQSQLSSASPTVALGQPVTITLQAVDASGNLLTSGGLAVAFDIEAGPGKGKLGKASYAENGQYTVTFTGTVAGSVTIQAIIGGKKVKDTVTVTVG